MVSQESKNITYTCVGERAVQRHTYLYTHILIHTHTHTRTQTNRVSHLPPSYTTNKGTSRVAGVGMNTAELSQNPQLSEYTLIDLNKTPTLPYKDDSFDAVLCALTIDYLTRPISVVREMTRVLRPGGLLAITFSNRLFFTKAVANWAGKDDVDHCLDVATYLHYGGKGGLSKPAARDLSPSLTKGDPLYVVFAFKK